MALNEFTKDLFNIGSVFAIDTRAQSSARHAALTHRLLERWITHTRRAIALQTPINTIHIDPLWSTHKRNFFITDGFFTMADLTAVSSTIIFPHYTPQVDCQESLTVECAWISNIDEEKVYSLQANITKGGKVTWHHQETMVYYYVGFGGLLTPQEYREDSVSIYKEHTKTYRKG